MIDSQGDVRLTGFRQLLNILVEGKYKGTAFSLVGDNIEWAAPEVMAQDSNYDEKTDVYSFGITALELAFCETPFNGWAPLKILLSKLNYDCPAIKTNGKVMSGMFCNMVLSCLHRDPTKRPSVFELIEHPFFSNAKNRHFIEMNLIKVKKNT